MHYRKAKQRVSRYLNTNSHLSILGNIKTQTQLRYIEDTIKISYKLADSDWLRDI